MPTDHARRVCERFWKLADALVGAHAVGIVHRDLKPQNVLIGPGGDAKIADFGLALLTTDASLSRTGEFLGTYLYASPEQGDGSGSAVDERSDVFSLGATLYENLTLQRPFDGDSARTILRAVTLDPPAPHTVMSRVPPELSHVCMRALEKRPQDRYASMAELRDDLRRFLTHEPVLARRPTLVRRMLKWSQRHPTAATALGLSVASAVLMGVLLVRAERARAAASRAAKETDALNVSLVATASDLRVQKDVAEQVLAFMLGMFEQAHPNVSGDQVPTVRQAVETAVARLDDGEVREPGVRARIKATLGSACLSLADSAAARRLLEEALEEWRELGMQESDEAADATVALAYVLYGFDEYDRAEELLAPLRERIDSDPVFARRWAVYVEVTRGDGLQEQGRFDEALEAFERAEELCAIHPTDPELEFCLLLSLATNALLQGRSDEALARTEALITQRGESIARARPRALDLINILGMIMIDRGRLDEAEALFLDLYDKAERSVDVDHPTMLTYRSNLARVWEAQRRYVEAEELFRETADRLTERYGPMNVSVLTNWNNVATCLVRLGRLPEAERILRDVYEKKRRAFGDDPKLVPVTGHNLAQVLGELGRAEEALALQEQVVAMTPPDDPHAGARRSQLETLRARLARSP